MHITIQEGRSLPDLQRCTTCCEDFHCPFCASNVFHPAKLSKVKTHLESHFNRAVLHEGYTIHRYPATPIIPDPATPIIPDPATPSSQIQQPPSSQIQQPPSSQRERCKGHTVIFRKVRSTEEVECLSAAASTEDEHSHDEADLEHLRLPSVEVQYSRHLIPEERMCQHCPGNVPLSDPVLITHEAKILTKSRIVNDVSTYCKSCHQCGAHYRYQEWKDGLHNF
ncbi:Translation initiation factor IF-2 [Dissostichus eleginoides]|uniref:Translation initiation factor IF-2 n=1 Tax=Dissostichus eleginoides TaxID=100907 RepID=A0AAD9BKA5_DISEL|nr:Translation initiation factor IF-2 [Dissostichus eleginoides]